jgi:hypothetical protein
MLLAFFLLAFLIFMLLLSATVSYVLLYYIYINV